jgi:hypothetical protein
VAKLLFSGLLVASGLILGAFTLHASLAPGREALAPASRASGKPQPVDISPEADRTTARGVPDNWAPRLIKARPKPEAKPPAAADAEAAKAKRKPAADKQQKAEQAKQEEQTVFSWLAGLLSN